jgi:hypothetical protein
VHRKCQPPGRSLIPWKFAVEENATRSMPTRVFGGSWGRRIVGDGWWDGGIVLEGDLGAFGCCKLGVSGRY